MAEQRLIDVNDAIEKLCKAEIKMITSYGFKAVDICGVIAFLQNQLVVDAVPVVHGRWEAGVCTHCGFDLRELTDGENDLEQWVWEEGFHHCPNCGAKMDGGKKQ